jgi:hypothetical protein
MIPSSDLPLLKTALIKMVFKDESLKLSQKTKDIMESNGTFPPSIHVQSLFSIAILNCN